MPSAPSPPRVVLDTNVLVAALRSRLGASHLLLQLIGMGRFEIVLTVPLFLEYQEVLLRPRTALSVAPADVEIVLSYIAKVGVPQSVFYLWRPSARDPDDDLVIEAAVAGQCQYLVTFDLRHLSPAEGSGCRVLTPLSFLREIGALRQ